MSGHKHVNKTSQVKSESQNRFQNYSITRIQKGKFVNFWTSNPVWGLDKSALTISTEDGNTKNVKMRVKENSRNKVSLVCRRLFKLA